MCWPRSFPTRNGLGLRRTAAKWSNGSRPSYALARCRGKRLPRTGTTGPRLRRPSSLPDSAPKLDDSINAIALLEEFEQRDEDVVQLTIDLIAAPSPNPPGDETAPAALIVETCRRLGLPEPIVVGAEPHRANVLLTIDSERPGAHIGFCGHTDTKPVGDAAPLWRTDPFVGTIDGDRLYGLGSTDMKGALAAMLFAAEWLQRHRELWTGAVSYLFSADEEYGSAFGAYFLARNGH